jgi:DNA-binding transcriptional regulator WhiA
MIKKIITAVLLAAGSISFAQTAADSLHLKIFLSDRDYFLKLQETVSSKNQYIGLQWCIDLLNKYIEMEDRKFKESSK